MTVDVTFTGETLQEVASQARNFANVVFAGQGQVPADKPKTAADKPGKATKAKTEEKPKADAEKPADLGKVKEDALDILRGVYTKGKAGKDAVNKLRDEYGVKKLDAVPVEKAEELLAKAKALAEAHPEI